MAINFGNITTHTQVGSGTWAEIGTQSSSINTDIFVSSTSSRAKKVSNSTKGFMYQVNASGRDMSAEVACVRWLVTAGVGSLGARSAGGVSLAVQDTSGNISYWDVDGNDTYGGGWKVTVIDLSTTPTRNNGTAATLTAIEYVGMEWTTTSNVGGGDPNCYIDEVLSWPNTGITVTGNSTTLIPDLVAEDDLSLFGIFQVREEIIFSKAKIDLQPDATDMSSTGDVLVFENPTYDDGTNIGAALSDTGLISTDADNVTLTRCTIRASLGDESITGTDATRVFDISGATDFDLDTCELVGFDDTVALGGSGQAMDFVTFNNCAKVTETGAVMRDTVFRNQADATGAFEWDESTDMVRADFFSPGSGHGVHFTHNSGSNLTGGSAITFDGIVFTGYGLADTADASVDVDPDTSSIDVDFSIQNADSPTLDERSPYTGTAQTIQTVTLTATVKNTAGNVLEGISARIEEDPAGTLISDGTTNASGVFSDSTYNFGGNQDVFIIVRKKGYVSQEISDVITNAGLNVPVTLVRDPSVRLP